MQSVQTMIPRSFSPPQSSSRDTSADEVGLRHLREAVAPLVHQSRDVALARNTDFGGGRTTLRLSGIGEFLGETRYFSRDARGELAPVRQYPRNAEEAQQFQVDGKTLFETNQRLRRMRGEIEALRRLDNGPTDLNPQPGVVVESGRFGPRNRPGIPAVRSLTYDRNGNVDYETRIGEAGSSKIESYSGNRHQFRYVSQREGQEIDRVLETTPNGFVRSWRRYNARD